MGGWVGSREEAVVMVQGETRVQEIRVRTVEAGRSEQDNGSTLKVESTDFFFFF